MEDAAFPQIQRLLATRTGLHIRQRDREHFRTTLASRLRALKLASAAEYHRLLESNGEASTQEWRQLIALVTNGESYFFRDKGQMTLLEERILPDLIDRNRCSRSLRLWSAGCSTGEEPYSLAILLDRVLPQRRDWTIHLIGTDINEEVLERARQAVYPHWSFRDVPTQIRDRYFLDHPDAWRLDPQIRSMVTFRRVNLLADPFPRDVIREMDLILCRNVFIYFEREAVAAVLRKYADTLKPGGYLITGHAELHAREVECLLARRFPHSIVYQRPIAETAEAAAGSLSAPPRPAPTAAPPRSAPTVPSGSPPAGAGKSGAIGYTPQAPRGLGPGSSQPSAPGRVPSARPAPSPRPVADMAPRPPTGPLAEAEAAFAAGDYMRAVANAEALLRREAANAPALLLAARSYANLGRHDRAVECCREASAAAPLDPTCYLLLAHISEERGSVDDAKAALKKVVYLAPQSVAGYLELGSLYEREGDGSRARKMWSTALELLRSLEPGARVPHYDTLTAAELTRQLRARLGQEA
jgi:chemotaxis protein methyltransferase CheR